jgi:hypothetical protein
MHPERSKQQAERDDELIQMDTRNSKVFKRVSPASGSVCAKHPHVQVAEIETSELRKRLRAIQTRFKSLESS